MDFNSERLISKNIYRPQSNEGNESKDINLNENEQENEEEFQANLLYTWGFSKYGQTGHENTNYILSPTIMNFSQLLNSEQFPENIDIEPVAGESHSALLIQDFETTWVYMFGKNVFGQLGIEDNSYIYDPILLPSLGLEQKERVTKISLGGEHSLILTEYNNIYTCGLNIFGQLGTGDFENRSNFTNMNRYSNV